MEKSTLLRSVSGKAVKESRREGCKAVNEKHKGRTN